MLNKFGIFASEIRIIEGSGLSRKNMVSPYAVILLLDFFKPYSDFLPQEDGKLLKSGTLKGVYSFGGYFHNNKDLDSFVCDTESGKEHQEATATRNWNRFISRIRIEKMFYEK